MKLNAIIFFLVSISCLFSHPKYPVVQYDHFSFIEEKADSLTGFDILKYDVSIQIDDQNQSIEGVVVSTVLAEEELSEISYELEGLEVDAVFVNGTEAAYTHSNGVINTDLGLIPENEEFELTIHYSGNPILAQNPYSLGMFFQGNGLFTISCPNASRYWWPCYDHPWDKAIVDLNITVREDWDVASNGLRTAIVDNQDGTRTHYWEGHNPMATYLVSIVARPFVELTDSYNGIPIQNFVPPNMVDNAIQDFATLPLMMEIYSEKFGAYPFEKYGNAVTNFSTYAAMEHQTMSTLANFIITGNQTYEVIIAHELAHQWFGNCLTSLTWKDVWLSEGFATYAEAIYVEATEGYEAMLNYVQSNIQNYYLSWASSANHTIYDPPSNAIFTPVTYEKAGSVLHVLRSLVGDDTFYEILQTYFETFKHGNVITDDFKAVSEQVSGLDLEQFFLQWIYQSGIPVISYAYFFSSDEKELVTYSLSNATSGTDFFTHVPIQLLLADGQDVNYHVQSGPQSPIETRIEQQENGIAEVLVDPENWIINRGYVAIEMEMNNPYAAGTSNLITWNPFWQDLSVDGYQVFRATEEDGTYEQISDELITNTFYYDENIVSGEEYFYTVKAAKFVEGELFSSRFAAPKSVVATDFPLDQGILVVDETYDGVGIPGNPNDEMVDTFYQSIINADFTTYDVAESGFITLEVMRHYSTVIYHDDDISQQLISNSIHDLGSYLLGGGNVIISGWKTVSEIPQSFLQLFTSGNEWDVASQIQFTGAYSNVYADLQIDPDKVNAAFDGALMHVYTLEESEHSIYYYQGTENSIHEGKVVAIKENNLILLGFPLYYCYEDGASDFINQVLAEFGETSSPETEIIPAGFSCNAYPNPFNPYLTIAYYLPKESNVAVSIYNVKGQKINSWSWNKRAAGNHQLIWDGTNKNGQKVSSGIFFYQFKAQNFEQTQKVLLVK